jgi:hypothetical protein
LDTTGTGVIPLNVGMGWVFMVTVTFVEEVVCGFMHPATIHTAKIVRIATALTVNADRSVIPPLFHCFIIKNIPSSAGKK